MPLPGQDCIAFIPRRSRGSLAHTAVHDLTVTLLYDIPASLSRLIMGLSHGPGQLLT